MSIFDSIKFDTTTVLTVVLIVAIAYFLYTYFYENEEENSNSGLSRTAIGGEKSFDKLPLKEQLDYLEAKQSKIIASSQKEYKE